MRTTLGPRGRGGAVRPRGLGGVRLVLPGELAKHAVSEGSRRAVTARKGGVTVSSGRHSRMSGFHLPMGDDIQTPTVTDPLQQVLANTQAILKQQAEDAHNRKIALLIAGASALFAAAKLGIIAIPHIRARIRGQ